MMSVDLSLSSTVNSKIDFDKPRNVRRMLSNHKPTKDRSATGDSLFYDGIKQIHMRPFSEQGTPPV